MENLKLPAWVKFNFFEKILQKSKNADFTKLIRYKLTPVADEVDYNGSVIFRANLNYMNTSNSNNNMSLIVKAMPESGQRYEILKDRQIFDTEIKVYRDVIPKFEEILRTAGDYTIFSPKLVYSSSNPHEVIVFEDVKRKNFTSAEKMSNYDEVKKAMEKLAKWHAISYKYNIDTKGSLEQFRDSVFNNQHYSGKINDLIDVVKTLDGFEDYIPKLEKINKTLHKKCQNVYSKTGNLNVLNHGDFHQKNLMFNYDESGRVNDVLLIDFQRSVWGSMAIDLLYLTYNLMNFETRTNKIEELRYIFFTEFIESLKLIGYQGELPTFIDLQIEFIKFSHIELYLAFKFLPFKYFSCSDTSAEKRKEMLQSSDFRMSLYTQPDYIRELKIILPKFLYKGFLDGYD